MERLSDPGEVLPFIGTIDEIAAFDTVLDASQRAQLWNGGSGVFWSSEHNAWGPCGWSFAAMGPGRAARAAAPARAALGLYVPATEPERVVTQYLWGARPGHRDELILRDRDSDGDGSLDERLFCLMDYFNGISILDEEGTVQERYRYSAFGVRTVMAPDFSERFTSDFDWEFGFQGQFLDLETGWMNYGYRYYIPWLGRWPNRDPIGEEGGANIYAFIGNNGINGLDFLGLEEQKKKKTIGFILGPDVRGDTINDKTIASVKNEVIMVYGATATKYSRTVNTGFQDRNRSYILLQRDVAIREYKSETGKECCSDFDIQFSPVTTKDQFQNSLNIASTRFDFVAIYAHGEPTDSGLTGIMLGFSISQVYTQAGGGTSYWAKPYPLSDLLGPDYKKTSLYVFSCYDGGHPKSTGEVSIHLLGPGSDKTNTGEDFIKGFRNLIKSNCCDAKDENQ
jgi:RHS repeat-associated protein